MLGKLCLSGAWADNHRGGRFKQPLVLESEHKVAEAPRAAWPLGQRANALEGEGWLAQGPRLR